MPFIVKFLLMIAALVGAVFYPVYVLAVSLPLFLFFMFKPQPNRSLIDLIFPENLTEAILTFVVVCASGVSLAAQLLN